MMLDHQLDTCGCCEGIEILTPRSLDNPAGLSALLYRVGTHSSFKESMISALSKDVSLSGHLALGGLSSREDDDPSIALIDGWATVLDVLTFYQERIANEGYLRTASERMSLLELARSIGYELSPGVSASTFLAFELETSVGAPLQATIDIGTKVQSIPEQAEKPQTFETSEIFEAKAAWNELKPRLRVSQHITSGMETVYLEGANLNLEVGDLLLFVGKQKRNDPSSHHWDVTRIVEVETNQVEGYTLVTFSPKLATSGRPFPQQPSIYTFRQRAAIFGHNAQDWRLLPDTAKASYLGLESADDLKPEDKLEWPDFDIFTPLELEGDKWIAQGHETIKATPREIAAAAKQAAKSAAEDMTREAMNMTTQAAMSTGNTVVNTLNASIQSAQRVAQAGGNVTLSSLDDIKTSIEDILDVLKKIFPDTPSTPSFDANVLADDDSDANILGVDPQKLSDNIADFSEKMLDFFGDLQPDFSVLDNTNDFQAILNELSSLLLKLSPLELLKDFLSNLDVQNSDNIDGQMTPFHTLIEQTVNDAGNAAMQAKDAAEATAAAASAHAAAALVAASVDASMMSVDADGDNDIEVNQVAGAATLFDNIALGLSNQEFNEFLDSDAFRAVSVGIGGLPAAFTHDYIDGAVRVHKRVKTAVILAKKGHSVARSPRRRFASRSHDTLDLDQHYAKILEGGWLLLSFPEVQELYSVSEIVEASRADYGLSSKTSRATLAGNLATFNSSERRKEVRMTSVYAESEGLELATMPLGQALRLSQTRHIPLAESVLTPLYGNKIILDGLTSGLLKDHLLILQGKPSRVRLEADLVLTSEDQQAHLLAAGDILTLLSAPVISNTFVQWHLKSISGIEGTVLAQTHQLKLLGADKNADAVAELVSLREDASVTVQGQTLLELSETLTHLYDRATVSIFANVVPANHGETKTEVLGSGNAAEAFQHFTLKQKPLTYTSAKTPSGTASSLEVRVNDILWQEADSFYGLDQKDESFITKQADDGTITVQFGDGETGARPATGFENITTNYRVGIGMEGMLKAGQLSLLMTRPLGVKGVKSPLAPTGAQDPETRDAARQNAPLTVLTLDRIVSLQDYEDFARAFAGIGKAQATQLWQGENRLVHITVAAADGGEVSLDSELYTNLIDAIAASSPPRQQVLVASYKALKFKLSATLTIDARFIEADVIQAVRNTLLAHFSFEQRSYAQAVSPSEVMAVMQGVEGVIAVDLNTLYLTTPVEVSPLPPLPARRARWDSSTQSALPAELLTLDPNGIDLGARQV